MRKLGQINNQTEVDKILVGLGNVDNTSDVNKPISTATQIALNNKQEISEKGQPNGYASLGNDGKVPTNQLPSAGLGDMLKSVYDAEGGEKQVAFKADVQTALNTKQETLVSGVNIKTINGQSLPGSGDIVINGGLVGTKQVDETNIADGKTLVYKTASGKYELETPSTGGGLSWGASITGTSGTGLTTTIGANASDGTIGLSFVRDNTQSTGIFTFISMNAGTNTFGSGYMIDMSVYNQTGLRIVKSNSAVAFSNLMVLDVGTGAASGQAVYGEYIYNRASSGYNTGIFINNYTTLLNNSFAYGRNVGLSINQVGVEGTAINIYGNSNINSSTNGLVNYTLSNTQSGATVMQKIDTGTSAQGHTGLNILMYNASTSAKGININKGTTGTGNTIYLDGTGTNQNHIIVKNLYNTGYRLRRESDTNNYIEYFKGTSTAYGIGMYGRFSGNSSGFSGSKLIDYQHIQSGPTVRSLNFIDIINKKSSGGITDNYNICYIKRENESNTVGQTYISQGSVLQLENVATQTTGTLTDTVSVLTLIQGVNTTGSLITMVSGNTNSRAIDFATNLTTATAPTGASTYINVKINGVAHRILAQAV